MWPSYRPAFLISAAFAAIYFAISWRFAGPGYLADEVGYLLNAAALTGDRIDGASSYHFGYSLLIAPAFLVSDDPDTIWRAVQAINAVMLGANLVALYAIGERIAPEASAARKLAALVICGLSPIALVMAGYSFATPAFVLVYSLSVLALCRGALLTHAALAGFLFWVHPVAAGVVVASLLAVALLAIRTRTWVIPFCVVAIEVVAVALYRLVLSPALVHHMTPAGYLPRLHYESFDLGSVTPLVLWEAAIRGMGQLSYVAIGTLGFAVLGFAASVCAAFKAPRPADQATGAYTSLSLLGVIGIGALMFATIPDVAASRPDHWLYGRYADGVVLPLLLSGLLTTGYRRWAIACVLIPAAFLALIYITPEAPDFFLVRQNGLWPNLNLVNVVAFWPAVLPDGAALTAAILLGAAVAAIAVLLPMGAVIPATLAAFALSASVQFGWHQRVLTLVSKPTAFPEVIRRSWPSGTCVGVAPVIPEPEFGRVSLYKFHLHNYDIRRMTPEAWREGCEGPYITSRFADIGSSTSSKVAARELDSSLFLLARPDHPIHTPPGAVGLYRPGNPCLLHDRCFFRSVDDISRRGHSQVGAVQDGAVLTTGKAGYLLYGPGLPFEAGQYRLSLDIDVKSAGESYIEVVDGVDQMKTIARFELKDGVEAIDFELPTAAPLLQILLFVDANVSIVTRGYALSALD